MSGAGERPPPLEEEEQQLVLQAMPMVRRLAKRIHRRTSNLVELADLVGIGALELADHARRLDPKRKEKFESYASPGVFGAMMDYVADHAGLEGARRELFLLFCRGATLSLAALSTEGQKDAADAHAVIAAGILLGGAAEAQDPEAAAISRQLGERLAEARGALAPQEQQILELHWDKGMPLEAAGATLGISRSTVKLRHRRALGRLHARVKGGRGE